MSQTKYCVKCGAQLLPNAKFCASCGTPVSLLPTQPASVAVTKRRPWFSIIAVIMIVLAFLGGASIAPERVVTTTTTATVPSLATITKTFVSTAIAGPLQVKVGQTFTFIYRDVPFEVTFTELRYADKIGWSTADKGYKFAILYVAVKNPGIKESSIYFGGWTLKVDKGYVYEPKSTWNLPSSLRPGETNTGYLYFEIPQDTMAVEIRCSRRVEMVADIILVP